MKEILNYSFGPLAGKDALGRILPTYEKVGSLRENRYVGIFYFICNGQHTTDGPYDITKILQKDPNAIWDDKHPLWGPIGHAHHWGEPLYGYYFSDDEWVIRKHIKMLILADIDFLVFDTTNLNTYNNVVSVILRVLEEYRQMGWKVPKVVYYTNTDSGKRAQEIYEFLYKSELYPELWFYWEGKPLIITYPEQCPKEMKEFFTFRLPQWPTEPQKQNGFPWIDFNRPQQVYYNKSGDKEIISVSVAQHPQILFSNSAFYGDEGNRGRSFHDGRNDYSKGAVNWGYNFSEQWEFALEQDPQIVFVTGWNEWTAGRIKGSKERPITFIDEATQEFSRDIEPMRDGHFDNYYMQLVSYVRRFKGTSTKPLPGPKTAIDINGDFSQWEGITPVYQDFTGDIKHRSHSGFGGIIYENSSGRNDFNIMKVTRDDFNVYFYVKTLKPITPYNFTPWMWLLISITGSDEPNWEGYHFLINNIVLDYNTTFIQKCKGGWRWEVIGRIKYRWNGCQMHLAIPRRLLGIGEEDTPFEIQFKWVDDIHGDENIEDFYINGDTAPFGRFNYVYSCK